MTTMPMPEGYEEVAACTRRNGAWLVTLSMNDVTQEFGHHEMIDCAGSAEGAKKVARAMVGDWSTGTRWEKRTDKEWVLWARLEDTTEGYWT